MRITLSGHIEGYPEGGKLQGVCGTDYTRRPLDCDFYNGRQDWTVTEVVLHIGWYPYKDEDQRFYLKVPGRTDARPGDFFSSPSRSAWKSCSPRSLWRSA
jgi:hypothetical protein